MRNYARKLILKQWPVSGISVRQLTSFISIPALALGLLFFAGSLTPSLIPRDAFEQGILGGIVIAIGYLLIRISALVWRAAEMPQPTGKSARVLTVLFCSSSLITVGIAVGNTLKWQNDLRTKMGIAEADALHLLTLLGVTVLTFLCLFAVGVAVAYLFRVIRARLYRIMPVRRANVLALFTVAALLLFVTRDGLLDSVVAVLDESYETAQRLFESAPPRPAKANATGSSASLIDWAAMGEPGRDFVTSGPDAHAIAEFLGVPAMNPIRVYVGLANGNTPGERADLALAELKRQGAFEREVLIVASPTGTGWMDPGSHDPLEYMHGGNIATVAAQYSYLQSPLALILETRAGLDQAAALLERVHSFWKTLPANKRPRLYVHGLSLGAWSSMYATNLFRLVDDPINGAFWAGPPFSSQFWNYVQTRRKEGSPWVLPTIGDGSLVRYASRYADASEAETDWGGMRIVFLQYSSDPIVFYDPHSIWRAPPWMRDPPAEDASEYRRFYPIVTHFQLAIDMALSFGSPPGHGHSYFAQDYITPWVEVTDPSGWTTDLAERLKAHCNLGFGKGCRKTTDPSR
ncbi:alpha/beta hydrolase [Arenibacterium sp. CAU 1754]